MLMVIGFFTVIGVISAFKANTAIGVLYCTITTVKSKCTVRANPTLISAGQHGWCRRSTEGTIDCTMLTYWVTNM